MKLYKDAETEHLKVMLDNGEHIDLNQAANVMRAAKMRFPDAHDPVEQLFVTYDALNAKMIAKEPLDIAGLRRSVEDIIAAQGYTGAEKDAIEVVKQFLELLTMVAKERDDAINALRRAYEDQKPQPDPEIVRRGAGW